MHHSNWLAAMSCSVGFSRLPVCHQFQLVVAKANCPNTSRL
jgi:hypothetical protein